MSITKKIVKLTDKMIENLEEFQKFLGFKKYFTARRKETFNHIEELINEETIVFEQQSDRRFKIAGYWLCWLGETHRIDHCRASFVKHAYLDLESQDVVFFNKCVCYSVK